MYFVATRRKANLRKSCAQHLDDLEQESGINFRAHRRGRSASSSTRKEDPRIKKWPPLEAVVDEIIARCS